MIRLLLDRRFDCDVSIAVDADTVPLPVLLTRVSGTYELNWDLRSVAAIVTTIVPLIVFLIFLSIFTVRCIEADC